MAYVPTDKERDAVFSVDPPPPPHLKAQGQASWRRRWQRNRAVWKLAYYLGGPRPESELCRLRWRDVIFPEDVARFRKGETPQGYVMFVKTKTDRPRSVPMHFEAEAALRSLMPTNPDPAAYVLHQRNKPHKAWTRQSYYKAWHVTVDTLKDEHPNLAGMWLRDFRKAAITDMREGGTDRTIAAKTAGHGPDMSDDYTQAPDQYKRAAISRLGRKTGGENKPAVVC